MRLFAQLLASCLIVIVAIIVTALAVLQSQYGLSMAQIAVKEFTPYQFTARSLDYSLLKPFSLALEKPELIALSNRTPPPRYTAEYLSFSLAPFVSIQKNLTFNNVIIHGLTLDQKSYINFPKDVEIQHLALKNVNYKSDDVDFRHAKLQLSNWKSNDTKWGEYTGEFQFSAPEVRVKQQRITHVLVDSEFQNDVWNLHALSFNSALGNVMASAKKYPNNRWVVEQLTLSNAKIANTNDIDTLTKQWAHFAQYNDVEISRLDLLNVSIALTNFSLEHLNLSAQSIIFTRGEPLWANLPPHSLISFNANLLRIKQLVFTDFLGELSTSSHQININTLSAKINDDGFVSLSGKVNALSLTLDSLAINDLDLHLTADLLADIDGKFSLLEQIDIKKLAIKHANIYALEQDFPAQIIDLNIHGRNLAIRKNGHYGMWQGSMTASASITNINHIVLSSSYANMSVLDGIWKLNPLSLSFINGQLTATAEMDLNNNSRPWAVNAHGLNIPNQLYAKWFQSNFSLLGEHDVELSLSGLASNKDSFSYSLTGHLQATPYNTALKSPLSQSLHQSLQQMFVPFKSEEKARSRLLNITDVNLAANRGRIELAPVKINSKTEETELSGEWDLVTQQGALSITPNRVHQ